MLIYDDQRKGCHMGLACTMEKLGLLHAATTTGLLFKPKNKFCRATVSIDMFLHMVKELMVELIFFFISAGKPRKAYAPG